VGDETVPHLDWLDGSVMTVWDEYRSLIEAAERLIASLQHPDRGKAFNYPQFARLRSEWFAIRRNVTSIGAIGQDTITPTRAQIEDLFTSWTNKTSSNDPRQQITRAKYATYDPVVWGRETDKQRFLYIVMDRDLTRAEVNTWGGKHSAAVTGDEPEPEHNSRWINYEDDLITPGHLTWKQRPLSTPAAATKADVRDPGRIIVVATGRPETIVKIRVRERDGTVETPNRIDEGPVRMERQPRLN
jgi:hypothetical protein